MKTNRILIAILLPITIAACATDHAQDGLTPISRWALALTARLHTPQWKEPSDSCQKIADHWKAVVKQDLAMAWHFANRPDLIQDSTVIQLTGEYVPSDSLPIIFERHMAKLDTAENVAENYMIDQRRLYSTDPEAIRNAPITEHTYDRHVAEMTAFRTAISLYDQLLAIDKASREGAYFFGAR